MSLPEASPRRSPVPAALFAGIAIGLLLAGGPAPAGEAAKKAPAAKKDGKSPAKESAKKESEASEEGGERPDGKGEAPGDGEKTRPAGDNLAVPDGLPEKTRKDLEAAIEAFRKAEKGEVGRASLIKEAIEKLTSFASRNPKLALPLYYLGQAYQLKRNFAEARRVLEKAVKLDPRFHQARLELGDVRMWQKDYKSAIAEYDRALEIVPDYAEALERKGLACIQMGRFEEAAPFVGKALQVAPRDERTEFRKALAAELATHIKGPGWSKTFTAETSNFQVLTSVSDEFAKEIAGHAELIRRAYDKVFDRTEKPKRKFPIWVYADMNAYHAAGNPPMAGGHYSPLFRKLVIFRYPKQEQTLAVLYHEAFHQYLHDYLDDAPTWFNEGLAEYFGAFQHAKKGADEKMLARPNRVRLPLARQAAEASRAVPAADLMLMTQRQLYQPQLAMLCYAEAWAIMYFIHEGNKPEYRKVLVEYYRALARGKDHVEAYNATFGKLDMAKFDRDWKAFIKTVK